MTRSHDDEAYRRISHHRRLQYGRNDGQARRPWRRKITAETGRAIAMFISPRLRHRNSIPPVFAGDFSARRHDRLAIADSAIAAMILGRRIFCPSAIIAVGVTTKVPPSLPAACFVMLSYHPGSRSRSAWLVAGGAAAYRGIDGPAIGLTMPTPMSISRTF